MEALCPGIVIPKSSGTVTYPDWFHSDHEYERHMRYDLTGDEWGELRCWYDPVEETRGKHEHLPLSEKMVQRVGKRDIRTDGRHADRGIGDQGKSCRKAKANRQTRRDRADTHRQMDSVWVAEITEVVGINTETYLDGFGEVLDIQDHLDEVNEAIGHEAEPDHKWFWDVSEDMFTMSEAHQNCHGFNACDPADELMGEDGDSYLRHTGLFSSTWDGMDDYDDGFWGEYDHYHDPYLDDSKAEAGYIGNPVYLNSVSEALADDQLRFELLVDMGPTQEEWEAMDDIALAEEADQEEFEARFEHLPASNATGTKARMSQRVLIAA